MLASYLCSNRLQYAPFAFNICIWRRFYLGRSRIFDVPREIIWVFLVLTVILVFSLVVAGLFGGLFLRLVRRERRGKRWFNHPGEYAESETDP